MRDERIRRRTCGVTRSGFALSGALLAVFPVDGAACSPVAAAAAAAVAGGVPAVPDDAELGVIQSRAAEEPLTVWSSCKQAKQQLGAVLVLTVGCFP
jgi:hypothetical protein